MKLQFHAKYRTAVLTVLMVALLAAAVGCGAGGNVETTVQATVEAAAPAQTTAAPVATTAQTTVVAYTEDIEDSGVDAEFADYIGAPAGAALPPVAQVAGLAVTQPEFRYMLNAFKSALLLNTGIEAGDDEDVLFWTRTASNGTTRLDEARDKVLAELHRLKICEAVAESRGIALDQDDYENINMDVKAQIDRFGGKDAFEKILSDEYGIDLADYWKISESVALRDKLYEDERDAIIITEGDVREYYEQNLYAYGDMVRFQQILFLMEGADLKSERSAEETKKLAEDTLDKLIAGADMASLATQISEEPGAALGGGERMVARDDPYEPEEILEWAFEEAKEGDYAIVETSYGYYVVHLEGRIHRAYEDLAPEIEHALRESKLAERIAEWQTDPAYALKVDKEVLESIS